MAEATVNIQAISVPVDDGEISRALTDVDAKLAVWAEAMLEAQRLLTSLATRVLAPSPNEPEAVAPEPEIAAPEAEPAASVATEPEIAAEPPSAIEPEAVTTGDAETAVEESEATPIQAPPPANRLAAPEIAKSTAAPIKFTGKMNVEAKPPQPAPAPPPNEDQQLLASLDPETAKAIKVMRRLAPSKKSVKELLAEYQADKTKTEAPKPEKKSWFSRGR